MFGSLLKLTKDVAEIVTAPVEIAIDAARVVTKPTADMVQDAVKDLKEATEELIDE